MKGLCALIPSIFDNDNPSQWLDITIISAALSTFGMSVRRPRNLTLSLTPSVSTKCFTIFWRTPIPANQTSNLFLSNKLKVLTTVSWSFASLNPATIKIAFLCSFKDNNSASGAASLILFTSIPLLIVEIRWYRSEDLSNHLPPIYSRNFFSATLLIQATWAYCPYIQLSIGAYHFQSRLRLEVVCSVETSSTEHTTLAIAAKSCGEELCVWTISYPRIIFINFKIYKGL